MLGTIQTNGRKSERNELPERNELKRITRVKGLS